ncbi:hypothetical protein [Rhodoblastus sp.]|uniref:hypothetical protein n=1 Tax=Rhodoblastus sp. TaxID=1962975 RepID=UPI003F998F1E
MRRPLAVCGALLLAFVSSASAMSYFTPANVTTACTLTAALEQTVLADEQLANQIAGKQVVRTGATSTVANVTPTLCAQLGGAAATLQANQLATAATESATPAAAPAPAASH